MKDKIKSFVAFSLALDECCDATGTSQLGVFIRGVESSLNVVEEFLCLFPLKGTTRGVDVFNAVMLIGNEFDLDWDRYEAVSVTF